jgi:hypothetical protein
LIDGKLDLQSQGVGAILLENLQVSNERADGMAEVLWEYLSTGE